MQENQGLKGVEEVLLLVLKEEPISKSLPRFVDHHLGGSHVPREEVVLGYSNYNEMAIVCESNSIILY